VSYPSPPGLRYLVLGGSILENVARSGIDVSRRWTSLEPPYHQAGAPAVPAPAAGDLCFGFFGTDRAGFQRFCDVARGVRGSRRPAEFRLIGYVPESFGAEARRSPVTGLGSEPLSRCEFSKRAAGVSYALWLSNPEKHDLVASASLLDILAFAKPGVYLRSSYVESYFRKLGNIGYLCDSVEEVENRVAALIDDFPAGTYAEQTAAIVDRRSLFEPATQAPNLRAIIQSIQARTSRSAGGRGAGRES